MAACGYTLCKALDFRLCPSFLLHTGTNKRRQALGFGLIKLIQVSLRDRLLPGVLLSLFPPREVSVDTYLPFLLK